MNPPPNLPEVFGVAQGHRRMVRTIRSKELVIRARHRRKATVVRLGVLALFGLSMVIYPVIGTLSPAANAAEKVPGVIIGVIPETIEVVMGKAPNLPEADLPLPDLDDTAHYLAISSEYFVSTYLPNCDGSTEWEGTNGAITEDSMCILWDGVNKVRSDAAVALAELNHAFKMKFGRNVCIISSYRTLGDQVRMRQERGRLAAGVGQSYHGWGLAIDVCPGDDKGERKEWLHTNGPIYGWVNPNWAKFQMYEPWHMEYAPGAALVGWASEAGTYDSGSIIVPDTS
ncbi:MAG: M15 family metallopeptidase, partial [Demequinaceae bacterium]|nr:M15 family metallopeptidase [Demequinaceae bacterium]